MQVRLFIWNNSLMKSDKGNLLSCLLYTSMVELYTMQRYLQHHTLVEHNLQHFDAWASTFGETVTAIELAPEGTGYRLKTRFAKFYNLPELMQMFREVADIQTADMLNLPVPEAEYRVVSVKPSEMQREMVVELGERAERVREGLVNATEDNMLLITNDEMCIRDRHLYRRTKVGINVEDISILERDRISDSFGQN